jgi:hypothetical protein
LVWRKTGRRALRCFAWQGFLRRIDVSCGRRCIESSACNSR